MLADCYTLDAQIRLPLNQIEVDNDDDDECVDNEIHIQFHLVNELLKLSFIVESIQRRTHMNDNKKSMHGKTSTKTLNLNCIGVFRCLATWTFFFVVE